MIKIEKFPLSCSYNYFKDYLNFLNIKKFKFLNFHDLKMSFVLIEKKDAHGSHLVSPIHFQNQLPSNYLDRNLEKVLLECNKNKIATLYVQTKNEINQNSISKIHDQFKINVKRFRTNFYLDLNLTCEQFINNMSKMHQRIIKKGLMENYKFLRSDSIDSFCNHYISFSSKKNFNEKYLYNNSSFKKLINIKNIHYLELQNKNNDFIFGGFFGAEHHNIDYLYGCRNQGVKTNSHVFFFEAFKYFKKLGYNKIYLGGGTIENDSLYKFKKNIGGKPVRCSTIRCYINPNIFKNYSEINWFDGYFPFYTKR